MGVAETDTALETTDIALIGDDIGKLPYLYALSNTANGVIRQHIVASLAVKALLAAGDIGLSLDVTGNAMRLSRLKPDRFFDA